MNKYEELKRRHEDEVNALPIRFAFGTKQFSEMMEKWGISPDDTDKIYKLGDTGGFYLRKDAELIRETFYKHERELNEAIDADKTGDGFIYDMFLYELRNHEYCITYDYEDTLYALDFTYEDLEKNPNLKHGIDKAARKIIGVI